MSDSCRNRPGRLSKEERKAFLLAEPFLQLYEPYEVFCIPCGKIIKLPRSSGYSLWAWIAHRDRKHGGGVHPHKDFILSSSKASDLKLKSSAEDLAGMHGIRPKTSSCSFSNCSAYLYRFRHEMRDLKTIRIPNSGIIY